MSEITFLDDIIQLCKSQRESIEVVIQKLKLYRGAVVKSDNTGTVYRVGWRDGHWTVISPQEWKEMNFDEKATVYVNSTCDSKEGVEVVYGILSRMY